MDRVLSVVGPGFSSADAVQLAAECFGVAADSALDVGSERDQAFMLGANGSSRWVLKVSNAAEDPATLQMEAEAARHAALVEPALSIAQPITSRDGGALARTERGAGHWLRLYDVIPGRARVAATDLDDAALRAWGATSARLTRAMRSFFHPSARRTMLWDVQHAHEVRPLCEAIADSAARQLVERALDQFAHVVQPRWLHLRSQVVHGDLTTDNALVDDSGRITGIVDFGDMCFSALASDLVAVLDSLGSGRSGDELRRAGTLVIDGYQTEIPLEPLELEVLPAMWAARAAVGVAISWWRSAEGLEDAAFAQRYNESALAQIDTLLGGSVRFDGAARGDGAPRSVSDLAERRAATFGPAIESLTYDEPLIVDRAEGCWIFDHAGRRLLDLYNNVPCVGHAHPRVAEAIARQSRRLNTNLRYLHEGAVSLAERLCATFPAELDTVLLVNSGSEANDLAWRLARQYTGNHGALCTAHAYHGITEATAALSPEMLPGHRPPDHVGPWLAPDTYRGIHLDTSEFRGALDALAGRGLRPALTILDGVLQSDGVHDLDPGYVGEIVELTRRAGGVFVADEVQGGFGRTGTHLWSFERFGITPDIVTLGKPMGNGHPVAAVITRRQIAAAFAAQGPIFSTFGGNQVSVAAAHAVLDVIRDERLLDRVVRAGVALRSALGEVCAAYECVGEVRGIGLACAVEIVTDRRSRNPDARRADALKNALRRHGVLVGTTGIDGNVLKVRPPLALDVGEHVDVAAAGFSMSLAEVAGRG